MATAKNKKAKSVSEQDVRRVLNEHGEAIEDFIMNGGEARKAYYHLRDELKVELKSGDKDVITAAAEEREHRWTEARPVERALLRLNKTEYKLRQDLMNAILNLELTDPRDLRDAAKEAQGIMQVDQPQQIASAIDFLEEAGAPVGGFRQVYADLYPEDPDEDEEKTDE